MADHVHILGICGTFMGGLALLARDSGYRVSGSDANVYPPMSTQLIPIAALTLTDGYDAAQLAPAPDCVVVGNALVARQLSDREHAEPTLALHLWPSIGWVSTF